MMLLTSNLQNAFILQDAFMELANIGVSRAAKQLSKLLKDSINISIPKTNISGLDDFTKFIPFPDRSKNIVTQELYGDNRGAMHLVFDPDGSKDLVRVLVGILPGITEEDMDIYKKDALLEVGNIILSNFIMAIGETLEEKSELGLPTFHQEPLPQLVSKSFQKRPKKDPGALIVRTILYVANRNVMGTLLFILTLESISMFVEKLEKLLGITKQQASL